MKHLIAFRIDDAEAAALDAHRLPLLHRRNTIAYHFLCQALGVTPRVEESAPVRERKARQPKKPKATAKTK